MLVTKLLAIALSVAAMAVSATATLRSTAQEDPVPEGMFRCSTGELRADPLNCPAGGRVAFSNKATVVSSAKGRCADGTEVSDEANCDGTNVIAPPSYDGKVEVPQGQSAPSDAAPKFRQTLGAVLAGVPVFKAGSKL